MSHTSLFLILFITVTALSCKRGSKKESKKGPKEGQRNIDYTGDHIKIFDIEIVFAATDVALTASYK